MGEPKKAMIAKGYSLSAKLINNKLGIQMKTAKKHASLETRILT